MSLNTTALRIKVTLKDVKSEVMRRLVVPVSLRLDRLHLTLQAALGWTNSHLFEFLAGEGRWGIPDPHGDFGPQPIDARKARLCDIVHETGAKTIHYLYDFGDSWDHVIKLEKWFDNTTDGLPLLLESAGRCPPEDVGGAPGYAEYLDAIRAPIRSTNTCAFGGPNSSIPTSSTGRRSRPPSTHCPEFGSHDGTSCDQNRRKRQSKGHRATLTMELLQAIAGAAEGQQELDACAPSAPGNGAGLFRRQHHLIDGTG
ncbi:plasmid pRiA4b ORF-3 family protein [Bradyrhizobium sp. SSUT18]|uniref:plasmid pRiA4b ORF-3 family protein n=1 Tax=Bradyrhizobium sp. SSUT18 TaxID=3040602 RepID=UPI00244B0D9D|nr:plasmid pRiA4b ORF-3 family protein [Bradyrhizobium sp. SSUT18]MDH2406962.1 plasmid pRiA4b ORF-3 family protein [Bradyrhizobium sp. SSUT18]